ncbi:hypothetical protein R1flu_001536 [Riccia fluitans]|uniref:Uncharacterized protein n=1 Tax=Riccia fluitans TaxID=41844 RepID=A0ABD1Y3W5_9MARC
MPLHHILKNALLEVKAVARCLNPMQFETWKENRDELLRWIGSTERTNYLVSHLIISSQQGHLHGICTQATTQEFASNQGERSHFEVMDIFSDQGPLFSDRQTPIGSPSERSAHVYFASLHLPDNGENDGPRLTLSAALHTLVVENTGSNSLTVYHTANSGELCHNEKSYHEDFRQLVPNYDKEKSIRNDGNKVSFTSERRRSDVPMTSDQINPALVLESINTMILGLDLTWEEVIILNQQSINDTDNTPISTAPDLCRLAYRPTWNEARQENTTSASIRIPIRQDSLPGGRECNSDLGEWRASHRPQ